MSMGGSAAKKDGPTMSLCNTAFATRCAEAVGEFGVPPGLCRPLRTGRPSNADEIHDMSVIEKALWRQKLASAPSSLEGERLCSGERMRARARRCARGAQRSKRFAVLRSYLRRHVRVQAATYPRVGYG